MIIIALQNDPALACQRGLILHTFLDMAQLDDGAAHRLRRQIPASRITRTCSFMNPVCGQIAACHDTGHWQLDDSMVLRIIVHFHVHDGVSVVLVSQPQRVDIRMPCHHSLEVGDALRHWRCATRTMVSIKCPAGPLIFPENLNVPESTPSASDDVDIRQLIESVNQD